MGRFYGAIGFISTYESEPGIWETKSIERKYYGTVQKRSYRWDSSSHINDDLNVSNVISIIADSYLLKNAYAMKYIEFSGSKWKISSFEIDRPRITLTIGGLYNGE